MIKSVVLSTICFISLSSSAQQIAESHSVPDFNKSTGLKAIIVDSVRTPYPSHTNFTSMTSEQFDCVKATVQAIQEAAAEVYGNVEALDSSLKTNGVPYRISLIDMTPEETRKVYGEGKNYARIQFDYEDDGSILLRPVINHRIMTYIDPETQQIACASSSTKQVSEFLVKQYLPFANRK